MARTLAESPPVNYQTPPPELFYYGHPDTAHIEPCIRETCKRINRSGWVWTVCSCEGHPPSHQSPWKNPFIRFGCRTEYIPFLKELLKLTAPHPGQILTGHHADAPEGWSYLNVYMTAPYAGEAEMAQESLGARRARFERLAHLVNTEKPDAPIRPYILG